MVRSDMGLFDFFRGRSGSLRSSMSSDTKRTSTSTAPPASSAAPAVSKSASLPPPAPASAPAKLPPASAAPSSMDSAATTVSQDSDASDEKMPQATEPVTASIQNYEIIKELGRGATAVVQLGKQKNGEQLVALKVFKTSLLKKMREVKRVGRRMVVSTALDKVQVEIAIMKKLHHPNLLNLLEVFDDDSETLVLMLEYAPHGQIMHWDSQACVYKRSKLLVGDNNSNNNNADDRLDEQGLRQCVRQLVLGLEYLHENNICHRDLKPENILLGENGAYKIADFGVAHFFEEDAKESSNQEASATASQKKKGYVSSTAGTYAFMAPETLKGGEFSAYAADVWALGITLYAMALGRIPYYHPDVVELFDRIENDPIGLDNNNASEISDGLIELIHGLLEKNPEKRLTLHQCKQNAWVLEGLDEAERTKFQQTSCEQVTVSKEEVMNAVTRVSSLNVVLRVKLTANKWKRKALKSLDEKKRNLAAAERMSSGSMTTLDELEDKHPPAEETSNQMEI